MSEVLCKPWRELSSYKFRGVHGSVEKKKPKSVPSWVESCYIFPLAASTCTHSGLSIAGGVSCPEMSGSTCAGKETEIIWLKKHERSRTSVCRKSCFITSVDHRTNDYFFFFHFHGSCFSFQVHNYWIHQPCSFRHKMPQRWEQVENWVYVHLCLMQLKLFCFIFYL